MAQKVRPPGPCGKRGKAPRNRRYGAKLKACYCAAGVWGAWARLITGFMLWSSAIGR